MSTTNTATERRTEYLPLDDIKFAEANPKIHDSRIRGSIEEFGFGELPLLDERTGRLVAGHGRIEKLREMRDAGQDPPDGVTVDKQGRWLAPVTRGWSSRSDAQAKAYLAASNRLGELGGWDNAGLADLLASIGAADPRLLEATGFDADDIADLLAGSAPIDLDSLAGELGEPDPSDMWPTIRVRVPPHIAAAWREYLSTHNDREVEAFAALLQVDAEPPAVDWTP